MFFNLLLDDNDENEFNENCCLWYFFHNSINIPIEYDSKNTYCLYFNCCPSCLELKYNNQKNNQKSNHQKYDKIILCCCFSIFI